MAAQPVCFSCISRPSCWVIPARGSGGSPLPWLLGALHFPEEHGPHAGTGTGSKPWSPLQVGAASSAPSQIGGWGSAGGAGGGSAPSEPPPQSTETPAAAQSFALSLVLAARQSF